MTPQIILLYLFAVAFSVCALLVLINSAYRQHMAPKICQALNACHDEIEFANINHVATSPAQALQKLSEANTAFKMAQNSLHEGSYKLCLEQAQSALGLIRESRKTLVICSIPMPVFPSNRIISHPDGLLWMGK